MKRLLDLFSLARRIPAFMYACVGVVGIAGGLWQWHLHAVAAAEKRGAQQVLDAAKFDSTLIANVAAARRMVERNTDSVITVVRWRVGRVDSAAIIAAALARQLPPEIDTLPSVVALKTAVFDLERATRAMRDSLPAQIKAAVDIERANGAMERGVLVAQLTESRLINARQAEQITELSKRPTRITLVKVGATALGAGFAAGRWIVPLFTHHK